jgi:hypothetical protein
LFAVGRIKRDERRPTLRGPRGVVPS